MRHKNEIIRLGNELVQCDKQCQGVVNNPQRGIIPRCLVYENRKKEGNGAIIIGINPGKCKEAERLYYLENGNTYSSLLDYWEQSVKDIAYFKKSRELLDLLGFDGDILWTDLAKCECEGRNGDVPVQTLRVCIDRFLEKEIGTLPADFTIVTLGNIVFNFCALRFPDRFVLGLPHPTGAYGKFKGLRDNILKNRDKYISKLENKREGGCYRAVKMFD